MPDILLKKRASVILIVTTVDNRICKLHQLVFKQYFVAFMPYVLKHAVDIYFMNAKPI